MEHATATAPPDGSATQRKHRGTSLSYRTLMRSVDLDEDDLQRLYDEAFALMERVEAQAPQLDLCEMWEPLLDFLGELRDDLYHWVRQPAAVATQPEGS